MSSGAFLLFAGWVGQGHPDADIWGHNPQERCHFRESVTKTLKGHSNYVFAVTGPSPTSSVSGSVSVWLPWAGAGALGLLAEGSGQATAHSAPPAEPLSPLSLPSV